MSYLSFYYQYLKRGNCARFFLVAAPLFIGGNGSWSTTNRTDKIPGLLFTDPLDGYTNKEPESIRSQKGAYWLAIAFSASLRLRLTREMRGEVVALKGAGGNTEAAGGKKEAGLLASASSKVVISAVASS